MANISKIKLPNGTTYTLKDNGALQLTGGTVSGPVSFNDSISIDDATIGDLVVNGSASFTNNIQANTINGVTVGSSPKFTDTNTVTTATTTGSGNAVTAITASNGALTVTKGTTFLTSHQDISGKADKSATVSTIAYDSTNKKITKTINGTTTDVVTVATLKTALGSMPASDVYSWAKASTKPTYTASEVGALASNTTYVSTITTTAGAHTAISNKSGAVSFNVPTKTSHLTNDSGFITNAGVTGVKGNDETAYRTGQVNLTAANIGAAPTSHTHSANDLNGGYINIHPENSPIIIPFIHNDIAHLLKRGGSAIIKYDNTTQSQDLTNCFDGSGSYWAINPSGTTTITIELTLHKVFGWTSTIYVDFGNNGWRSKSVKIEVMNSNYTNDVWTQKYNTTSNSLGHVYVITSHQPVGADNTGGGFNKIRFTFSDWNSATIFRIAQLGIYNYGSMGLRETYMSRGADDYVFRNITPNFNNTYNLGTSSLKWANIYATTFNGNVTGSAGSVAWSGVSSKPTTLSGYGITDAKIANGVITLGSNTISNKTAASDGTDVSLVTTGEKYTWNNKQDALVSGTNIKTINNESILGSGNIAINVSIPVATTSANGLMSSTDKTAVDKIGTGTLNTTNKTIIAAVNELKSKGVTLGVTTLKNVTARTSATYSVKTTAAGFVFINHTANSTAPNLKNISGGTLLSGPVNTGYTGTSFAILYAPANTTISFAANLNSEYSDYRVTVYQVSFS